MYIIEHQLGLISKANTTGYVSVFTGTGNWGSGVGTGASLTSPRLLALDSQGRLFVTEQNRKSIRMITW